MENLDITIIPVSASGVGNFIEVRIKGILYRTEIAQGEFTEDVIREREEIYEQIKALNELKVMAAKYGFDISRPAGNAKEAIQWLYFAFRPQQH